jgi:uncharacterized protein (DUF697 family)
MMNLPIDIPALLKEATNIDAARKTPLAVSVYLDETAPGSLIGFVRSAFASAGARTRVTLSYLIEEELEKARGTDDIAVIVAGNSSRIGEQAALFRAEGVPVMVVSLNAEEAYNIASASGFPLPQGDVVTPAQNASKSPVSVAVSWVGKKAQEQQAQAAEGEQDGVNAAHAEEGAAAYAGAGAAANTSAGSSVGATAATAGVSARASQSSASYEEAAADGAEVALSDAAVQALSQHMGEWIIATCKDKRLAFALAFPFVRRPLSLEAVHATSVQNAGVGVVAFIPGADMPIMTLNQGKMLLQIAAAYGQPMSAERVKELAMVVGGAFMCRNVARTVAGVVPVLGWAVKGAIGFAGTEAMGRAAIEYFEAGGDMVGVASVVQKARDEAVKTAEKVTATPAGQAAVDTAKKAGISAIRAVAGKASASASSASASASRTTGSSLTSWITL